MTTQPIEPGKPLKEYMRRFENFVEEMTDAQLREAIEAHRAGIIVLEQKLAHRKIQREAFVPAPVLNRGDQ